MLDLNRIPKPVKNPKNCGLRMLANDGSVPTLNLFKNKRCRGWWPMFAKDSDQLELVGKVEAEFHLLTQEEASGCKVGIGREDPEGLPEPSRPDTSFLWFMNPLKTLKYVIWKNFKWKLLKLLIFVLIIAFLVLFFYSAPGATVNKIFGVK
ncbi:Otoferlin [Lamellibrachia satsuma]|nr:Otoferlin [Lamellibrachia satsuma]